jgi:membrane-associated protein
MEFIAYLIDLFVHLDKHLSQIVSHYGTSTYAILFFVIFAETGFVFTPFLPGDSLLFAAGAIAALGALNPHLLVILLITAAVCGDNTNYWIGHFIGPKVFDKKIRFLKKEYLDKTHAFYVKHGGKTTIIARFIPIIRTFAPFVTGIGRMNYLRFLMFDVFGGVMWVSLFIYAGFFFGNIPVVKKNFSVVIFAIIFISVLPAVIEFIKHKRNEKIAAK